MVKATGAGFILVPAGTSYPNSKIISEQARIYPQVGETYDFTSAKYAWVCGKPYNAPCCGISNGINAAGQKNPECWNTVRAIRLAWAKSFLNM